jgi:TolB-like protein/DNA-binding winged helix-turn-helix (wHTH) protein/Flp pilus assembly protein TadD
MTEQNYNFYEFGPFRLDAVEGVLIREGEPVRLTPKALKLLLVLVRRHHHLVEKDELIRLVWPDTVVEESNLSGNIHTLRQILGEGNNLDRYIETVPRRGYRFVAKVRPGGVESAPERTRSDVDTDSLLPKPSNQAVDAPKTHGENGEEMRGAALARGRLFKALAIVIFVTTLSFLAVYFWTLRASKPQPTPSIKSIAVLPLKNLSENEEDQYFADGFTEAMINELGKIAALRVISRTSVMQYRNAPKTIPEIARELKVDAVLEGSVLQSDDRVRITAQLIRAATDEQLWAESYERDLSDVLTLQREIARGVASEIKIKLTPQEQARLTRATAVNPLAHEAYLKGLFYLNKAINTPYTKEFEQLTQRSFDYFEQAIKLEPNYAAAHAALAGAYHWLASGSREEFYPKAKKAALTALALDDNLAEAHCALAFTLWRLNWDFTGAEREFRRAEELAPNSDNWGYAQFLSTLGRHDEAIQRFKRAQDVDPLTMPLKVSMAWALVDARQYDNAIAQFRSLLELAPNQFDAHRGLGMAHIFKGSIEEGIKECQKAQEIAGEEPVNKTSLGWAYAVGGRPREARMILSEMKSPTEHDYIPYAKIAMIHGALGEKDQAFAYLEKAYANVDEYLLWLKVDPRFDPLRSDRRFNDLVDRIGFPEN